MTTQNTEISENFHNICSMDNTSQQSIAGPIDSDAESKESYKALYQEDLISEEDRIKMNSIDVSNLTLLEFIQKMDNNVNLHNLRESIFFYIIENDLDKETLKMLIDCMISCSEKMIQ